MDKGGYRSRLYNSYVNARSVPLAPDTIHGLKSRAPYIRRLIQRHFPSDRGAAILDLSCGQGRIIADQNAVKPILLWNSLMAGRIDGALVRLVMPLDAVPDVSAADAAMEDMATTLLDVLPRFVPS